MNWCIRIVSSVHICIETMKVSVKIPYSNVHKQYLKRELSYFSTLISKQKIIVSFHCMDVDSHSAPLVRFWNSKRRAIFNVLFITGDPVTTRNKLYVQWFQNDSLSNLQQNVCISLEMDGIPFKNTDLLWNIPLLSDVWNKTSFKVDILLGLIPSAW